MKSNAFKCTKCKKFTRYIELTWREFQASTGDTEVGNQVITGFCDLTGITSIIKNISGWRFWKCCECGDTTIRNAAGDEI